MASSETVIPQLEIDPEITEAQTIGALYELRDWYEECATPLGAELAFGYNDAASRFTSCVAKLADVACTDGAPSDVRERFGYGISEDEKLMTVRRVDADLSDSEINHMTELRVHVSRDQGYRHNSIDGVAYPVPRAWHEEVRYLRGRRITIAAVQMSRHTMYPVFSHGGSAGLELTHHWGEGEQRYVADKDASGTIKLGEFPGWKNVHEHALRQHRNTTATHVLATADYGELLGQAAAADRKVPSYDDGLILDSVEAMKRLDPWSGNRDALMMDVNNFCESLNGYGGSKPPEWLISALMKPEAIRFARLGLMYTGQLREVDKVGYTSIKKRLEWVLYYAPKLQYDTHMLMSQDEAGRREANTTALERARELAGIADEMYATVMHATVQIDPQYWDVNDPAQRRRY